MMAHGLIIDSMITHSMPALIGWLRSLCDHFQHARSWHACTHGMIAHGLIIDSMITHSMPALIGW